MSSLSLHDALSSLLPGRGAPDFARPGLAGPGDGMDIDGGHADAPRPGGPHGAHDGDGPGRPPGFGDGGNGPSRHLHGDGPPPHARPPMGDGTRGPPAPPLAPPVPQGSPGLPGFGHGTIHHGGSVLPPQGHPALADALRGPGAQPLAPPVPQGPSPQGMYGMARSASFAPPHMDTAVPVQARQAAADPVRGPAPQPLAPPTQQGSLHPSLDAIARELQQLPASMLRQLGEVLHRNPDALRSLPAQPEALASVLSRTGHDPRAPQAMAAEARRLAQGTETPLPARGEAGQAAPDARHAAHALPAEMRAAAEGRHHGAIDARAAALAQAEGRDARAAHAAEARAGSPSGNDPAQAAHQRAPAEAQQTLAAALTRPESTSLHPPPGTPVTGSQPVPAHQAPAGTTQAQPATTQLVQDAPQMLPARAEVAGSTVERGGQPPGLSGLGGAAAGVTLAAVANPAGTTHAHAPEAAIRARGGPQEARERGRRPDGEAGANGEDADGGGSGSRRQGTRPGPAAAGTALPAAGEIDTPTANGPSSVAAGHALGAARAGGDHVSSVDGQRRAAMDGDERPPAGIAAGAAGPLGHTVAHAAAGAPAKGVAGEADEASTPDPEALRSRRRQWLYWSLIAVTYGCLGVALAAVAPELTRLPIAPESLGAWRNALTGIGLLTGLWAWLLARRMR